MITKFDPCEYVILRGSIISGKLHFYSDHFNESYDISLIPNDNDDSSLALPRNIEKLNEVYIMDLVEFLDSVHPSALEEYMMHNGYSLSKDGKKIKPGKNEKSFIRNFIKK